MQTQAKFRFRKATTPPTRHPGSDLDRAPRIVALVGAVVLTALGMVSLASMTTTQPAHHASATTSTSTSAGPQYIHGIPVFDLPSVNVSADVTGVNGGERVASTEQADTFGSSLLRSLNGNVDPATLIGSQLAMPYYSFGSQFGHISKD